MTINSQELLPTGTRVKVGNEYGTVTHAELVQAHPCGFVALHTICFDTRRIRGFGNNYTMQLIKPRTRKINYSFIEKIG